MADGAPIRTPDQRLRVFVSSTLGELAPERAAVRSAVENLRLVPVMFELGARPHPPRELYRAYLEQSQVFVGVYWQRYGWVAPGQTVSGLEDEYLLAGDRPQLVYIKEPAPDREPELVRLLAGIRDRELGSYKRFGSAEELSELVQQDLAILLTERFAASSLERTPQRVDPQRSRPPVPLTPLIGRERERAAIGELLTGGTRLVTLTGTGGIGKTRLAQAVAGDVERHFPDGVHVVPLASVTSAPHLPMTLSQRLGLGSAGSSDATTVVHLHLARQRVLLVLDNLEQIAEVGSVIVELLERCPGVQVLATSRRPLRVVGEHEWPLEPLEVAREDVDASMIAQSAAVELFVDRARAAAPGFVLDERNAAAVADLCRRLDGLPLAIELAAARVRLLPPAVLVRRLGDRLDLLTAGPERPERQRTLRATIEWSARLLSEREMAVFARLSVFRGGCTLAAAEHVCDPEARGDVVETVAALLDHGLLTVTDDRVDDEPRIRMLETIRTDAAMRLDARGETSAIRARHLGWFARFADTAQPYLCGPEQVRWVARVEPERENLRAAATFGLEAGDHGTVLEMAWDLYIYYHLRGAQREPEAWVKEIAVQPERLDERQRAVVTTALAIADLWRGDPIGTRDRLQEALAVLVRTDAGFEAAVVEMHLGLCDLEVGAWVRAADLESAAISRFAEIGHDWGMGSCENLLGVALAARGEPDAARACHERALAHGRRIGNASISAQALILLAANALDVDDLDTASAHLGAAISLIDHVRDVVTASGWLEVRAAAALAADDRDAAAVALGVAGTTRERLGTPLTMPLRRRVERLVQAVAAGPSDGAEPRRTASVDGDAFVTMRELGAPTVTRRRSLR
jgi:predicted ATPase